ncbi:MAG TPA: hypothetical protein V6C85_19345 [Allocoleopsis sp.]
MAIFRQFIAPFLIVLVFLVALLAVSARIFLPSDMAAPAPIEEVESASVQPQGATAEHSALPTSARAVVN